MKNDQKAATRSAAKRPADAREAIYARDRRMTLARAVIAALAVAFAMLMLRSGSVSDVSQVELSARLKPLAQGSGLVPMDANALQKHFGIVPDDLVAWLLFGSADSVMNVDELLVVRAADADSAERCLVAAQTRLDAQKEAFRNYGTDQYDRLEHAILWTRDTILFYAVGDDAEKWESQLLSAIR